MQIPESIEGRLVRDGDFRDESRARSIETSYFAVIFGAIFSANVLTMSFMNFTEARTSHAPGIYIGFLVVAALLMRSCRVRLPSLSARERLLSVALAMIFSLPRIGYLFEDLIGYALIPLGDDNFHIPNVASIVHTEEFPPRSTYDSREFLAYYYAPWMPGAVFYYAGLADTVKQALGLTKVIYCFLISYSLLYAGRMLFKERRLQVTFVIICALYGGFDFLYWISQGSLIPTHSEWWALQYGFTLQYSSFITMVLWTPQHFLAAVCVFFCLYLLHAGQGRVRDAMVGLLLLSALFTSPFSVFGAIPASLWYAVKYRKLSSAPVAGAIFIILSIPLWWILLGNERVGLQLFGALSPFWQERKLVAFVAFLLVVTVELGPLIVAAAYSVRRWVQMRVLFALSVAYLVSTFFLFYSENFSMRGSIAPVLVLMYLATPVVWHWWDGIRRNWLSVAFVLYLAGGLLEYASFARTAVITFGSSLTGFNAAALRSNKAPGTTTTLELTEESSKHREGWRVIEKHKPVPKTPLIIDEARQMHPDNCYRVTVSRILDSRTCRMSAAGAK